MASSNKRERDRARARYEAQQARRAAERAARRQRQRIIGAVVATVVLVGGIGWFTLRRGPDSEVPAATSTPAASPTATAPVVTAPVVAGCKKATPPTTKTKTWPAAPKQTLSAKQTSTITLATNCGEIVISSTPALIAKAPKTTNAMAFLAREGFWNASSCFRLTNQGLFVLQCGSPTNNGVGGPGFTLPDENLPKDAANNYPAGTVAMANSGPGTAGSQFFLVYKDTKLGPNYTIWGQITKGLDILKKVAAAGTVNASADGAPKQQVVITTAKAASS